jgi:hypothetical protein
VFKRFSIRIQNCYVVMVYIAVLGFRVAAENSGVTGCSQKRKAADTVTSAAKKRKGSLW